VSLALVLVEPAGPLNVGSVARLCANFGLDELRLVAPRCDPAGEEARRMAVHGGGLLERARQFPDLAAALADCRRVVATSGRVEQESLPLSDAGEALHWLLEGQQPAKPQACWGALVFGREDRGLSNDELLQAGRVLRLETGAAYSSLNLSHAVAICLHELQRQRLRDPAPALRRDPDADPCPRAALEDTLADAEALLLQVGFLYPHTAHARIAKLRALLQRAAVREPELALLRGMVRQLRWAADRRTP
jgi:tRNA/rRNA methyltransferase